MMNDKNYLWSDEENTRIDEDLMEFMAGNDIKLDRHLFVFDIQGTTAHISGLNKIGILTDEEYSTLNAALEKLEQLYIQGKFKLDNSFEDGHSAIEFFLTQELGDLGKKCHTGRSRNDQVLTCSRLFMRYHLKEIKKQVRIIIEKTLDLAEKHQSTAMPGYTHLQRAMPNSVAVWLLGFTEALIDDSMLLDSTLSYINASPLGTAAGFGVPLDLPRQFTAQKLGFNRVQINPVYTQNSRGKFDLVVLQTLYQLMLNVRRFSWDLSLFMTDEFNFIKLNKSHTTGSSIMPNKSNPDVVELMRASLSVIEGSMSQIQALMSLPSGYQRDLQMSKEPMIKSVLFVSQVMNLIPGLIDALNFNTEVMESAISQEMMATDKALAEVKQGKSFRDAYGNAKKDAGEIDFKQSLADRVSLGGASNLGLMYLRKRIEN